MPHPHSTIIAMAWILLMILLGVDSMKHVFKLNDHDGTTTSDRIYSGAIKTNDESTLNYEVKVHHLLVSLDYEPSVLQVACEPDSLVLTLASLETALKWGMDSMIAGGSKWGCLVKGHPAAFYRKVTKNIRVDHKTIILETVNIALWELFEHASISMEHRGHTTLKNNSHFMEVKSSKSPKLRPFLDELPLGGEESNSIQKRNLFSGFATGIESFFGDVSTPDKFVKKVVSTGEKLLNNAKTALSSAGNIVSGNLNTEQTASRSLSYNFDPSSGSVKEPIPILQFEVVKCVGGSSDNKICSYSTVPFSALCSNPPTCIQNSVVGAPGCTNGGGECSSKLHAEVSCSSCYFTSTVSIVFQLDVTDFKLRNMIAKVVGTSTIHIEAELQLLYEFSYIKDIPVCGRNGCYTAPTIQFTIGPIPITITPSLDLHAGVEVEVHGDFSASIGYEVSGRIELGVQHDGTKLTPIYAVSYNKQPIEPTFEGSVEISVKPYLEPSLVLDIGGGLSFATIDFLRTEFKLKLFVLYTQKISVGSECHSAYSIDISSGATVHTTVSAELSLGFPEPIGTHKIATSSKLETDYNIFSENWDEGQPQRCLCDQDVCGVCDGDGTTCRGCDGVTGSKKEEDECGVCGGDGTSCDPLPYPSGLRRSISSTCGAFINSPCSKGAKGIVYNFSAPFSAFFTFSTTAASVPTLLDISSQWNSVASRAENSLICATQPSLSNNWGYTFSSECGHLCPLETMGDSICQSGCNNSQCGYDILDCCVSPGQVGDKTCQGELLTPECYYDGNDCCPDDCMALIGDGKCDSSCNIAACTFDGFDCQFNDRSVTVWLEEDDVVYIQVSGIAADSCISVDLHYSYELTLQELFVDSTVGSDTTGTGTSKNPFQTLATALNHVRPDIPMLTIILGPGTYTQDSVVYLDSRLGPILNIKISGTIGLTTLDCQGHGGLIFNNPQLNIEMFGMKFTNCVRNSGGALQIFRYKTVKLLHVDFESNTAIDSPGTPTVEDFEGSILDWTLDSLWTVTSNANSHSGSMVLQFSNPNETSDSWAYKKFSLKGGSNAILSFWYKTETGQSETFEICYGITPTADMFNCPISINLLSSSTWQKEQFDLWGLWDPSTGDIGTVYVGIHAMTWRADSKFYLDDIRLTPTGFSAGGAIWLAPNSASLKEDVQNLIMSDTTFTSNKADFGGAIATLQTITFSSCEFSLNHALKSGGAVATFLGFSGIVSLSSYYSNNSAVENGGAIFSEWTSFILVYVNSLFYFNEANSGGAIHNVASYSVLLESTLSHNTAVVDGGAVKVAYPSNLGSSYHISSPTMYLPLSAGELYTVSIPVGQMWSVHFDQPIWAGITPANGGIYPPDTYIISNCYVGVLDTYKIYFKLSDTTPGVLNITSGLACDLVLNVQSSTLTNNNAANGGAIHADSQNVFVTSSTISFNSADSGGALFCNTGSISFSNNSVVSNSQTNIVCGGCRGCFECGQCRSCEVCSESGCENTTTCSSLPTGCENVEYPSYVADGYCDEVNNFAPCWDGGDCCKASCKDDKYVCGQNGFNCLNPDYSSLSNAIFPNFLLAASLLLVTLT